MGEEEASDGAEQNQEVQRNRRVAINRELNNIFYKQLNTFMAAVAGADANRKKQILSFQEIQTQYLNMLIKTFMLCSCRKTWVPQDLLV